MAKLWKLKFQILHIFPNKIQDFQAIGKLDSLEEIDIGVIPGDILCEEFSYLVNLKILHSRTSIGRLQSFFQSLINLQELSLDCNFVGKTEDNDFIGCTVLKLVDEDVDISSIFPSISELSREINIKQAANVYPDLGPLKNLSKVTYFTSWVLFVLKKWMEFGIMIQELIGVILFLLLRNFNGQRKDSFLEEKECLLFYLRPYGTLLNLKLNLIL